KPMLVKEEKQIPINKPAVEALYKEKEIPTAEDENSSPQEIQTTATASTVETPPPTPPSTPPSTPPVTPTSLSDFPQIGSVGDLPWTIINALPSLNYSQHVYRGSQSESYVVLNDQRKREGQSLAENVRVEHILQDGIILAYKEYQFK